jgi:uncharacterized protein (TIGR03086 family)
MSEIADRYRAVADGFTRRATAVPDAAWDRPAPCVGWVARDVVGHLVEWIPPFLHDAAGVELPEGPSIATDPAHAWLTMSDGIQALLDDPKSASRDFYHPRAGRHRLDDAIAMFILGDVLIHTWDLARATGLDEALDAAEVAWMFEGMQGIDEMLRQSGQYGPKIDVDETADLQTRLIAFTGRRP